MGKDNIGMEWLMQLYADAVVKMEHCAYIGDKAGELRHKETAERLQWAAERLQWAIDYAEEGRQQDG
jgi:hypothetical protein